MSSHAASGTVPEEALGRLFHEIYPAKKAVVIYSTMRSGSTLLKALLGTNPEISHLAEVPYQNWPTRRYAFYYRLWESASQRVVVLKKPCFYTEIPRYPLIPPIDFLPIIAIRNPVDTALSLAKRVHDSEGIRQGFETYGKSFISYWCETYRNIRERLTSLGLSPLIVCYEELVREPERVTQCLFQGIGTIDTAGVRTYQPYGQWQWGRDDAGERIWTLEVQERPRQENDDTNRLLEEVHGSDQAAAVMRLYQCEGLNYHDYLKAGGYL
jgi:hypothetical protein